MSRRVWWSLWACACAGTSEPDLCDGETSALLEVRMAEGVSAPSQIHVLVTADGDQLYDQVFYVAELPGTLVIYQTGASGTLHIEIDGTSDVAVNAVLDVKLQAGCQVESVAVLWSAKTDPECAPVCDEKGVCASPGPEKLCGDACFACDGNGSCTAAPLTKIDACQPCDETGCVATLSYCQSAGECQSQVGSLDCCELADPAVEEVLLCERAGCQTAP